MMLVVCIELFRFCVMHRISSGVVMRWFGFESAEKHPEEEQKNLEEQTAPIIL